MYEIRYINLTDDINYVIMKLKNKIIIYVNK